MVLQPLSEYLQSITVNNTVISEGISYTHLHITNPLGIAAITEKRKSIFLKTKCGEPSLFAISLYDETEEKVSFPFFYILTQ